MDNSLDTSFVPVSSYNAGDANTTTALIAAKNSALSKGRAVTQDEIVKALHTSNSNLNNSESTNPYNSNGTKSSSSPPALPQPSTGKTPGIAANRSLLALMSSILIQQAKVDGQGMTASFKQASENMIAQLKLAPAIAASVQENWNQQAAATQAQADMAKNAGITDLVGFGVSVALGGLQVSKASVAETKSVNVIDEAASAGKTGTSTAATSTTQLADDVAITESSGAASAEQAGTKTASESTDDAAEAGTKTSKKTSAAGASATETESTTSSSASSSADDVGSTQSSQAAKQKRMQQQDEKSTASKEASDRDSVKSHQEKGKLSKDKIDKQVNEVNGFKDRVKRAWGVTSQKATKFTTKLNETVQASTQASVMTNMLSGGINKLTNESPKLSEVAAHQKLAGMAEAQTKMLEGLSTFFGQNYQQNTSFREAFQQNMSQALDILRSAGSSIVQTASSMFR